MTLSEAVKTIKVYCSKTGCEHCVFGKPHKNEWSDKVGGIYDCELEETPCEWEVPPETNLYDSEEVHENCTVQILKNSVTGETSVGWWENGKEKEK